MHSASLQKFFTNKTHKKYCKCGKPSALLLEKCSYCGEALGDHHIAPLKRDPLLTAVLGTGTKTSDDFEELYRSFQFLVLKHRYPVGEKHLLVLPKGTFYDVRQLRKRDMPMLEKMYQKGLEYLDAPGRPVACGFSYPADYNHLHLHLVLPPFRSVALFERHVFYPLPEVQVQLQRGLVKPHPVLDFDAEEAQNAWIARMDAAARRGFTEEAMSACAKSTAWRKALELFEAMPRLRVEQDVVSHNALLEACVQKETAAGAGVEEILASMNEALILPNLISYSTALMAFEKEGRWEEGLQLLRRMRQTLLQLDVICYNSAMSACKVASQWQAAWQLLRPSETTVAGFSALCAASRCQWRAALRAVELALGAGRATVVMYASTLEAASCAAACAASAGASVASVWLMHSLEALETWGREAAWDLRCQAQKASVGVEPPPADRASPSARVAVPVRRKETERDGRHLHLLNLVTANGQWQHAVRLLMDMEDRQVPLAREDASEVSQAINTAAEPIRFEKRLKFNFLSSALGIQMHVQRDGVAVKATITACERGDRPHVERAWNGSEWEGALLLLSFMELVALQQDVVAFNAVMSACENVGELHGRIRRSMDSLEIQPDEISLNACLSSCEKAHEWQAPILRAKKKKFIQWFSCLITYLHPYFDPMVALQLLVFAENADVIGYNAAARWNPVEGAAWGVISACANCGEWRMALAVLAKITEVQVACSLLDEMPRWKVEMNDVIGCNAALSACEKCTVWPVALELLQLGKEWQLALFLLSQHVAPDEISCNAAISACAKGDEWRPATALFGSIECRGLQRDLISHNAALAACARGFQWRWAALVLQHCDVEPDAISLNAAVDACKGRGAWRALLDFLSMAECRKLSKTVITLNTALLTFNKVPDRC
ncbi:Pentatricopeptide repeat-containing protein At2g31400 [Durusdinium trenchii]|uniref:Chloroplastic n=1 Tax=Durusdinium trenchii TaxID=1381693 RepID=A0ABP0NRM4_9DINO